MLVTLIDWVVMPLMECLKRVRAIALVSTHGHVFTIKGLYSRHYPMVTRPPLFYRSIPLAFIRGRPRLYLARALDSNKNNNRNPGSPGNIDHFLTNYMRIPGIWFVETWGVYIYEKFTFNVGEFPDTRNPLLDAQPPVRRGGFW